MFDINQMNGYEWFDPLLFWFRMSLEFGSGFSQALLLPP
jgi:hypothetical protein